MGTFDSDIKMYVHHHTRNCFFFFFFAQADESEITTTITASTVATTQSARDRKKERNEVHSVPQKNVVDNNTHVQMYSITVYHIKFSSGISNVRFMYSYLKWKHPELWNVFFLCVIQSSVGLAQNHRTTRAKGRNDEKKKNRQLRIFQTYETFIWQLIRRLTWLDAHAMCKWCLKWKEDKHKIVFWF